MSKNIVPDCWAEDYDPGLDTSEQIEPMFDASLDSAYHIVVDEKGHELGLRYKEENGRINYKEPHVTRLDVPTDLDIKHNGPIYGEGPDVLCLFKDREKLTEYAQRVGLSKKRGPKRCDEPKWDQVKEITPLTEHDLAFFFNNEEHGNKSDCGDRVEIGTKEGDELVNTRE